ncbi:TetR/AcrR family transcriptional regulator [Nocardia sp. NPDC020380]|uniref:TetR/AcrR family transcriptional regulator n=1 Tax=Nocardia sp. NPDC020380 TaxID=3364309 RepID=UPI0037B4BC6C
MRDQQIRPADVQRTALDDPHSAFQERHRAARAAVLDTPRGRLIDALVECSDIDGYAGLTAAGVAQRAGVTLESFHEYFPDVERCFVEAVRAGADVVAARIAEELALLPPEAGFHARVESIVTTFCLQVAIEPAFAKLVLAESFRAGPEAVHLRDMAVDRFAELYRYFYAEARASDPTLPALPDEMFMLIPDAVGERTRRVILAEGAHRVPELATDFIDFANTVLGLPNRP